MTDSTSPLVARLASRLPSSLELKLYHVSTAPFRTTPLHLPPPAVTDESTTTVESHLLAVAYQDVLVFAIEVLVYVPTSTGDPTIFVSKADSSGYLPPAVSSFAPASSPSERTSILRTVATEFTGYVLEGLRDSYPSGKITIALFARSQTQYLFPNSAANPAKHVLSDRSLISWWCKVLNPLVQQTQAKSFLLVPGLDRTDVKKLLPPAAAQMRGSWTHGHPFTLDEAKDITVREVIPHFPDDPKARFMDELNEDETSGKRGRKWREIPTVDIFWEYMSHRQECALGRCVGFVWVILETPQTPAQTHIDGQPSASEKSVQSIPNGEASANNTGENLAAKSPTPEAWKTQPPPSISTGDELAKNKRSAGSDPTMPPRKKSKVLDTETGTIHKDLAVKAGIVLSEKRYERAIESLLNHADFGDMKKAKESSKKWIEGVWAASRGKKALAAGEHWDWGIVLTGSIEALMGVNSYSATSDTQPVVNVLTVRKKIAPAQ